MFVGPWAPGANAETIDRVGAAPSAVVEAGTWRWPLDGTPRVTRRFDPPDTQYGAGHRGVDLAGTPGAAVRAAGAGRVGYAGVLAGRGVVTVIHPRGLKTTYEPVRAVVHAGQPVAIGALLGRLEPGHPGCPVSACLHWGLLRGTTYLDPLSLIGAGRVRLLPLATDHPTAQSDVSSPSRSPDAADPRSGSSTHSPRTAVAMTAIGAVTATGFGLRRRYRRPP